MIIGGSVLRQPATALGTPGRLVLENGFSCETLELPWHDNQRGVSCVRPAPDGKPEVYAGRVWWSPTMKRAVVRFADKNGRQDCLIHSGNWAADAKDLDGDGKPEVTQVHGCTEVGRGYAEILRKDGSTQWGIKMSAATLTDLIESLRDPEATDGPPDAEGFLPGYHGVEIVYGWAPQ